MSSSLDPNEYHVGVAKTIAASRDDRRHTLSGEDKVEADPAGWSLSVADDGSADIISVFPAPGQTAPSFATLPHIVFRDYELSWAYKASNDDSDPVSTAIPWFALIVLTRGALELQPQEQSSFSGHMRAKINDTLGWDVSVGDLGSINDPALAKLIPDPDSDKDAGTKISAVAVTVQESLREKVKPRKTRNFRRITFLVHVACAKGQQERLRYLQRCYPSPAGAR